MGLAYSSRGLVHFHHDGKHDGVQADLLQEEELRDLHLDVRAAGRDRDWDYNPKAYV